MKQPIIKHHCPYCDKGWATEEEAKACAKFPQDILQEGDVLNWKRYRYGHVTNVDTEFAGFSAKRNLNYCKAMGFSPRDMFQTGVTNGVYWSGLICGGKEVHDSLLFDLKEAEDLVKGLKSRLKHAETLLEDVKSMWKRRGKL